MKRYIGIDAHLKSTTIAVMSQSGRRLQTYVIETNGAALKQCLAQIAGEKHICLEECELSEWLYALMSPRAQETVVIQAQKRSGNKSDAIDAWSLADILRKGCANKCVYKACGQFCGLREAVRGHRIAIKDMVRAKNRLRALYRSLGILAAGREIYDANKREKWLTQLTPSARELGRLLSAQLDGLMETANRAEQWMHKEALRYPVVGLLATAPGIGEIRAAQIAATVITPQRFRTKRQFWSYCGLAVETHSSSDWEQDGQRRWVRRPVAQCRGLNHNRHPLLKEVFKGAAMSVITLMPEHSLTRNYQQRLEGGTKPTLARLTLARQIAAVVLAMWKNQEDYDPRKHERKIAA